MFIYDAPRDEIYEVKIFSMHQYIIVGYTQDYELHYFDKDMNLFTVTGQGNVKKFFNKMGWVELI